MNIEVKKVENGYSIGFVQKYDNHNFWVELVECLYAGEVFNVLHYINGGELPLRTGPDADTARFRY